MKKSTRAISLILALAMLLSLLPAAALAQTQTAEIYDLRVEDLVAPVGIDDPTPSFSWKMKSDAIGAAQTAYAITVTDGKTELWNTGWVNSDDSVAIPYAGTALASSTEYTVSVKIKDQNGVETAPVESTFEMGLLEADAFADAKWIGYQEANSVMSSVTDYAIDFDFVIDSSAQGMCFGMADTGTFVMWQVNAWDNRAQGQIILRPHFKRNGGWVGYPGLAGSNIKNVDVTAAIGYNHEEVIGKTVHERIEVSGKTIKTYFGKDADNLVLADTYTHTSEVPLNNIGFRHNSDNSGGSAALWATTARTRPIWPS